ncbi:hypothetical protein D3C81_1942020 [compost metagenome]
MRLAAALQFRGVLAGAHQQQRIGFLVQVEAGCAELRHGVGIAGLRIDPQAPAHVLRQAPDEARGGFRRADTHLWRQPVIG